MRKYRVDFDFISKNTKKGTTMGKFIFIILATVAFLYELFLNILGRRSVKNPIPENLSDVYDTEKYTEWKKYKHENTKLHLAKIIVDLLIIVVIGLTNAFSLVLKLTENVYATTAYTIVFFTLIKTIFSTIIDYIDTFRIEEKYGFNKSTRKTFIIDTIKNLIISLILETGIAMLFCDLYESIGDYILIVLAGVLFAFVMIMTVLTPFFTKIFNKFTPLENKSLEEKLTSLLAANGITVRSVKVMNASLRTTKSNAYFAGAGKTKSIVLYDNLVNNFTEDEIVAVFAHEMGHAINKDTTKRYALSFASIAITVFALWGLVKLNIGSFFGFDFINYGLIYILASETVLPILNPLMGFVSNYFSRKAEYRADKKANDEGYGKELISALKKLARENFSDLSPDKTLVAFTYSHPTIEQRITAIEKGSK